MKTYPFRPCGRIAISSPLAYRSSAPYKNVVLGSDKTLVVKDPKPGKVFISVFCATTVDTEETKYGDRYVGRTEVLNGIPYTITTRIE